ncbi:MAG: hypothetical protein ABF289_05605 [Clostridiales bacterium]
MDEEKKLIEKLKRIEALFAGAKTEGEKGAAFNAIERIQKKLSDLQKNDSLIEYKITLSNNWSKKLFIALLHRYGLKPYRYYRQRYTTVMVKVPASFVDETLWPEFKELNETLNLYLESVTNRVISECIHSDSSETVIKEEKKYLDK